MQHHIRPQAVLNTPVSFTRFLKPLRKALTHIAPLESKGNRPIGFGFEDELKSLVYYHLQTFESGNHLIQTLAEDRFARTMVAPRNGVAKSTFFEVIGSRGLDQMQQVFSFLVQQATGRLPKAHAELGNLVVIDPTLIDCSLSVEFADYREGRRKMQAHISYDPHRSIPRHIVLTDGKANARQQVEALSESGDTVVMDRGFQCHQDFDRWHAQGRYYVCRIRNSTQKTVIHAAPVSPGGDILSDEWVILGSSEETYTRTPVRLVRFQVATVYTIATNRFDLPAEQIAAIYRIRWSIEIFFNWWKRFMRVYHLISRTRHGLFVQLLAGLITYLLLALYCHDQFGEPVSIRRVRQLQNEIRNQANWLVFIPLALSPPSSLRHANS